MSVARYNPPRCDIHTHYQMLDAMGIQLWLPKQSDLISNKPIFCAACLVLLPSNPFFLNLDQKKIFNGMLNVLDLNAEDLCIAWIRGPLVRDQAYNVGQEIAKWSPYSVLIMGESLAQQVLETNQSLDALRMAFQSIPKTQQDISYLKSIVQVTYHPDELLDAKPLKQKAYRDLLNLKDHLSKAQFA